MASYFGRRFFTAWSFLVYCTFFFLAAVLRFFTCSRTSWFFITNICSVFSLSIFCLLFIALATFCLRLVSSLRILCSFMFSPCLTRYVCRHTSLIFSANDVLSWKHYSYPRSNYIHTYYCSHRYNILLTPPFIILSIKYQIITFYIALVVSSVQ